MEIFKKQFLDIHLPEISGSILCLENGPCVTSERELVTILKTSLLLRQESHRLILIAAPVDHLLTSLSMAMRKEIAHNVYLPF